MAVELLKAYTSGTAVLRIDRSLQIRHPTGRYQKIGRIPRRLDRFKVNNPFAEPGREFGDRDSAEDYLKGVTAFYRMLELSQYAEDPELGTGVEDSIYELARKEQEIVGCHIDSLRDNPRLETFMDLVYKTPKEIRIFLDGLEDPETW